jgi:dTDP-4-amino-4,6-dideoxygalactose transaminase
MAPQSLEDGIIRALAMGLKCRAIVPVHLYGHPCDMAAVQGLAEKYGLAVIEDCSQSHGATVMQSTTGTLGLAGAFSLYPTKNLGAIGDAGVVVTDSKVLTETLKKMRQYGWIERNNSLIPGFNSRLDELQAAILRVRLKYLSNANERRREIAAAYNTGLSSLNIVRPIVRAGCSHVFHQYVVRIKDRDRVQHQLRSHGVSTMIHYPMPVHRQSAYRGRLPEIASLSVTEQISGEILSLPIFPEMTDAQIGVVCQALVECVS